MNHPTSDQPTREEFEDFKREIREEVREEVKQLREQFTEPIRITDTILLQTLVTQVGTMATDVGVLKQTTATKSQLDEMHQAIEKRFDAIAEVQKLILDRLPPKQ